MPYQEYSVITAAQEEHIANLSLRHCVFVMEKAGTAVSPVSVTGPGLFPPLPLWLVAVAL